MGYDEILAFAFAFAALGVAAKLLMPLAHALARRTEGRASGGISSGIEARLERMEQAIDSIAVEVERISEAQRFSTKLLSDKTRSLAERAE
jgi:hypothetical protein